MPVPSFNWSAGRLDDRSLTLLTFDVDGDVLTWRTLVVSDTTVQGHGDIQYSAQCWGATGSRDTHARSPGGFHHR